MTNTELSRLLEHTSILLDLAAEPRARGRGFRAAATRVASFPGSLKELSAEGKLDEALGDMNADALQFVRDVLESGQSELRAQLLERFPDGLVDLCRVPGIGPALAIRLFEEHGIGSVQQLVLAEDEARLGAVKGLGAKTRQKVMDSARELLATPVFAGLNEEPASNVDAEPASAAAESVEAVEADEPVEAAEAVEPAEPEEAVEPEETVEPAELVEAVESAELEEAVDSAEPEEAVESAEPEETDEPGAGEPGELDEQAASASPLSLVVCASCAQLGLLAASDHCRCPACGRVYPYRSPMLRVGSGAIRNPLRWLTTAVDERRLRLHRSLSQPGDGLWRELLTQLGVHAHGEGLTVLDWGALSASRALELVRAQGIGSGGRYVAWHSDEELAQSVAERVAKAAFRDALVVLGDARLGRFAAGTFDLLFFLPQDELQAQVLELTRLSASGARAVSLAVRALPGFGGERSLRTLMAERGWSPERSWNVRTVCATIWRR